MGKPGRAGSGKKKNAGVGVDFKRVKHKVGKKLPRAQNQTDTSFKSRTISLAQQSVAADKEGQAVTGRNLTLKDLLGQCGHYSERVRKDALQGLGELVGRHPEELRRHATLVMEAAATRITDGDKAVRTAARELLAGILLPALGGAALAPYMPLLMAHVCAAMTHLAEPIRADALGFLELLMSARPDLVAGAYLAPVLQHFSDLLSRGSRGRSIKAGSLSSLHGVVLALERFLARAATALAAAGAVAPAASGGGGGSGSTGGGGAPAGVAAMVGCSGSGGGVAGQQPGVLMWRRCEWPPAGSGGSSGVGGSVGGPPHLAPAAEGSGGQAGSSSGGPAGDTAPAAGAALLGHLLECWAEAGPSQLAETPDLVVAQCLTAILRSCDWLLGLWGTELAGALHDRASLAAALLKKVPPHFPVPQPAVRVVPAASEQLVLLNVAAAQLLARFLPSQQQAAVPTLAAAALPSGIAALQGLAGSAFPSGSGGSTEEQPWVARLLDWFAGVMADGAALPASDDQLFGEAPATAPQPAGSGKRHRGGASGGGGSSASAVPAEVYQSALDGSLQVLPLLALPRRQQLLGAAWQLWRRSPPRGSSRPRVLAFWRALLRDPAAAFYLPTPGGGPLLQQEEVAGWLAALPRFLFEAGTSQPGASEAALRLLLCTARCAPAGSPLAAALQELQPQLAPLFAVILPPPNAKQQQQGGASPAAAAAAAVAPPRVLVGPLASLPEPMQELAVDLLYHFSETSDQLLRAAAVVALGDAYPISTAVRMLDVLAARAAAGAADPGAFGGLLLNLLTGSSAAGLRQRSWVRHEAVVGAACRAALALGEPAAVAASLVPPLVASSAAGSGASCGRSPWAAYGLLQLSIALATAAVASEGGSAEAAGLLPEAVAAALPHCMLQFMSTCQQQQQQQGPAAANHGDGGTATAAASSTDASPSCQQAAALCLRLVVLLPHTVLPLLLAAVPGSLQQPGTEAEAQQVQQDQAVTGAMAAAEQDGGSGGGGHGASAALAASLQLLVGLLREQRLHVALLQHQKAVAAALAACRAASTAAGTATHVDQHCLEQLQQAEVLRAVVLGS